MSEWEATKLLKPTSAYWPQQIAILKRRCVPANSALIFHESGGGPFPPEMFDEPPPAPDPKTAERDQRLFEQGCRTAKIYREKFPQIRLIVGNSGDSMNLVADHSRRIVKSRRGR